MTMAEADANHDDSRSYISTTPVALTTYQPENESEFTSLCDFLERNDPSVTSISTLRLSMIDQGYGRDLGRALQRNTVVSTLYLDLDYLVASERLLHRHYKSKLSKRNVERMALLLHWMEHSCSLRNVRMFTGCSQTLTKLLHEQIVGALIKHGNIQSFESRTSRVSLSFLVPFLRSSGSMRELKILPYSYPALQDNGSDDIVEDSARAVGALHQLEVLSIKTLQMDPFLRHLPTSPAFNTTLRELTLNFLQPNMNWRRSGNEFQASVLCQLLSNRSCRLQRLELQDLDFHKRSWTLLSSALLRSNPSSLLRTLVLKDVRFSKEASQLFWRDMQSDAVPSLQPQEDPVEPSDLLLHHIHDLRLTRCVFDAAWPAVKLGYMLCGTFIRHFTLDFSYQYSGEHRQDFFDVLTIRGTASCLRSIHFPRAEVSDLFRLAPYIATAAHLRRLTVQIDFAVQDANVLVPDILLSSLRQNGSLYTVDVSAVNGCTPNDEMLRRIQAYTMRNRALPQLMATSLFGPNMNRCHGNGAELIVPPVTRFVQPPASAFPTLGAVAEHSPQMAPNTFLKALSWVSKGLTASQDTVQG